MRLGGTEDDDKGRYHSTFRAENLVMARNGVKAPKVALAGVFDAWIRKSGPVEGLHLSGPAATLGLPLLAWFSPESLFGLTEIQVSLDVDTGTSADGTVRVGRVKAGKLPLTFDLGIGAGDPLRRQVRFAATSLVDVRTGWLQSAEGTVTDPNGTLSFRLYRR